jgi:hypothetical protein
MIDIDELRELASAGADPQFQDPDAYDKDEWLNLLEKVGDHIDDALLTLQQANELHEFKSAEKVGRLLTEAFSRLEDER